MLRATLASLFLATAATTAGDLTGHKPGLANPILPGYFADPSIVSFGGKHYIYATLDPWGGETLGCWESADCKEWTYRTLNWPTKQACTSSNSKGSMVWAPSVVRGADGRFHMYVSVGSEIWAGVADQPLGPWKDANGGKPLVDWGFRPGYHMIDAEAFVDSDGAAYLYWGSGHNWVNGKCWVVKLKADMVSFDGEVKDVTPAHYFEAPFMVKHKDTYYLMYSDGKTIEDTYQVHYAMGKTPMGPFEEAANSPILVTDPGNQISSPGHHSVFERDGKHYILYHRHSIPFDPAFIGRQVCVDELRFTKEGLMEKIRPTHEAPAPFRRDGKASNATFTASSERNPHTKAARAGDANFATLWAASADAKDAWIQMDLGEVRAISSQSIRFEYAWQPYHFMLSASKDGTTWEKLADHGDKPVSGSPIVISRPIDVRYLKIHFPTLHKESGSGIIEWSVK